MTLQNPRLNRPPQPREEEDKSNFKRFIDLPLTELETKLDKMMAHKQRVFRLSVAQKHHERDEQPDDPSLRLKKGRKDLMEEFEWAHQRETEIWNAYLEEEAKKAPVRERPDVIPPTITTQPKPNKESALNPDEE